MQKSIWEVSLKKFPQLKEDSSCDVCIVGGGLTGVSLAYYLKDASYKTILIEQGQLGHSTTMRSTAKLTYLQKDLLSKIKKCHGEKVAKEYYNSQKDAVNEIMDIIKKEKISCHLEKSPSYLFVQNKENIPKLEEEFALYKKFGAPIEWKKHLPMDCGEKRCCSVPDTYVFHPLIYMDGLLKVISKSDSVQIYETTRMRRFEKKNGKYLVRLQNGKTIKAKKLIFAGHYPPFLFPYLFPMKTYLEKEFVSTTTSDNFQFNAINLDKDILSVRFFENQMIRVVDAKTLGNSVILNAPNIKEETYSWNNYDIVTSDSLPIVGFVGSKNSGLYLGTGFNAWGITNSNLAAQILAMELQGKKHRYQNLCRPYRNFSIFKFFNVVSDVFMNVYHFVVSYFPNKSQASIIWKNGKRIGLVVDKNGVRHEIGITCPHVKCGLRYNPTDETWDCPCHGSRFDLDGNLLRGPSTDCVNSDTLS